MPKTNAALVRAVMRQTNLSARALSHVLAVDERSVRRWLAGDREIPGPTRQLLRALEHDPSLVLVLHLDPDAIL